MVLACWVVGGLVVFVVSLCRCTIVSLFRVSRFVCLYGACFGVCDFVILCVCLIVCVIVWLFLGLCVVSLYVFVCECLFVCLLCV